MRDEKKTKAQLIEELQLTRNLLAELKGIDAKPNPSKDVLWEIEERFHSLVHNSPDFIYVADADGKVLFINRTLPDHTKHEVIGSTIFDFMAPEDHKVAREAINEVFTTGRMSQFENVVPGSNETPIHLDNRFSPLIRNGKTEAFIGVSTDITQSKQVELALLESESQYRLLFNEMHNGYALHEMIFDPDGKPIDYRFIDVNPAFEKLTGLSVAQVKGKRVLEILPETEAHWIEGYGKVVLTGESHSFTSHSKELGKHYEVMAFRPKADHFACIFTDVTEHRNVEVALRASEERFRTLFENAPLGYQSLDSEGNFIELNETWCQMLGSTKEEVLGRNFSEFIHPDFREVFKENFPKFKSMGYILGVEFEMIKKDGSQIITAFDGKIGVDDDGSFKQTHCVLSDITQRKKAEEDKLTVERQLQHAQKLESLGVLAGGIAHDFNNLLMVILGNADLALNDLSPMSPARENLQEIEKASKRAADLAKQMLAYSGKGKFVIESVDAGELINEMAHLLEISISKKAVLKYNFAENLPSFDGDTTQIRQVIMNLITNASEALGEKSGVIALSTGAINADRAYLDEACEVLLAGLDEHLPEGVYVYFEVADTGSGMNAETIDKIFDPFFTTKFTGRGLGMSAVLGIIRGHGGSLKIYSEVGRGTTFKVLFPANDISEAGSSAEWNNESKSLDWQGSGTVLLADDEETICAVGKQMLERMGFDVLTANDGHEALNVYCEHAGEIVCVLLDLTMPRMDGEQSFRELRRLCPSIKVILCSGYNEQDATERFAGKGLAGFVQKPFNTVTLRDKLREVLGNGTNNLDVQAPR